MLFQDIRGFTSLGEKTPPEALLRMLNEFFTEMVAAVEAHGGVVKQFTGDGVMALFGAPGIQAEHPALAVRAALNMLTRTSAQEMLTDGILMTSVDTGWITDERPHPDKVRLADSGFHAPLDLVDGAARVYEDPADLLADLKRALS